MKPPRILQAAALMSLVLLASQARAGDAPGPGEFGRFMGVEFARESPGITAEHRDIAKRAGTDTVCLCGTCPKRLVAECDCGWAAQARNVLVNAAAGGKDYEQLVAAYRQFYGSRGLAMPPEDDVLAKGAWALPYAAAVAGLFVIFAAGARLLRRREEEPEPAEQPAAPVRDQELRDELNKALEDLD